MTFTYTCERGLASVELICRTLKDRVWLVPDLICDDVFEMIQRHAKEVSLYHINDDFTTSMIPIGVPDGMVWYTIDYFGLEQTLYQFDDTVGRSKRTYLPNAVIIRDGIWFEQPQRPLAGNEIWFNSYRKILWPHGRGSRVLSSVELGESDYLPVYSHINWDYRRTNYQVLKRLLGDLSINFSPTHPTLFPIRLKNREKVLAQLGTPLPGMWKNVYKLPNVLYKELAFIPLDERFNEHRLTELAGVIRKSVEKVAT